MKRAKRESAEPLGLREQKKLATRERVRAAAADLFTRHGYGDATMRGIAQRARRIRSREDPAVIARHIFFVYSASLRWWIAASRPNPEKGVADLRRLLKLQFDGLR